jgi:hypothetical protein
MSLFKNLSVGEHARIEAQLTEWSMQIYLGRPRIKPGSWTISDNLTVDVNGDVRLNKLDFEKLSVKFNKVSGWFSCSGCESLTSLEGAPKEVGGYFDCNRCTSLTSLEGAPKEVGGNFWARMCGKQFTKAEVRKHSKVKGTIFV